MQANERKLDVAAADSDEQGNFTVWYKNNRGALVQCAKHLQWSAMGKKKW